LAAVGPDVLTSWKVEVLTELYLRASRQLTAASGADVDDAHDNVRGAVYQLLAPVEQNDPWFERQLAALPGNFVIKQPASAVAETLRRLRQLAPRSGTAWAKYLPETDKVEFLAGIDQGVGRAIFSSMAGALTSNRMQIQEADTVTLDDGLLLLASRRMNGSRRSAAHSWPRSIPMSRRHFQRSWAANSRKRRPRSPACPTRCGSITIFRWIVPWWKWSQ
jgi:UTP:GlnB (protein PII) uridylyltransferase